MTAGINWDAAQYGCGVAAVLLVIGLLLWAFVPKDRGRK